MKRFNILKYIFLIPLPFLLACEKEISYKGGEIDNFLVLNAALSPDSVVACHISVSETILENHDIQVPADVKATLLEDGKMVGDLQQKEPGGNYILDGFKPAVGKQYEIRASYKDYPEVKAKTSIPELAAGEVVAFRYLPNEGKLKITLRVDDKPGRNFYRLRALSRKYDWSYGENGTEYKPVEPPVYFFVKIESDDAALNGNKVRNEEGIEGYPSNQYAVFNDELFDGKSYYLSFDMIYYSSNEFSYDDFCIDLQEITEDLHFYYKTVDAFHYYEDRPFSEPVRVFSNVNNGAGIVGGMNNHLLKVRNKD
ncbi:DUF4249 domain-containing protein [Marinilabiliaceae bacterium JC017]|nr:DUF4249 domain-containing protein [Marinilabiliaceae bacterium JC017]